ncbi:vWA domain-containing protein [Anianabacter salinae]|uniref:vWA domain-containing protein n=1 Tax=Anianabacter salinae TaxID=2851023 RepID=UPI00225E25E6|nr:VWA domain-containing protein [Anianabacter salinae]MBV0910927.1 VWA domain-containing protein [Anianabacter salinae]
MNWFQRVLTTAAVGFGVLSGAAQAQTSQNVILVLDGSGSMWGQIGGVSKIEIARDVIGDMLDDWDEDIALGLMAYGHRQRGVCEDIELVVPPQRLDKAAFAAAVNGVSPVGKTPLSDAVRQAAGALRYTEEKATVILVSDGLETCNADPCALGRELAATGIDFTTHVIGFDLGSEDAAQLACLADETGGLFLAAADSAQLTETLARTVEVIKAEAPEPEPIPEPEPVVVAQAEPEPVASGPQGLRVRAKLCEDCEIVTDEMFYWITDDEADLNGDFAEVTRSGSAEPLFELPADTYRIVARYGVAFQTVTATVSPGTLTELVVNMNAGHARFSAEATAGGTALDDEMFYWVYENRTDLEGNREEITRSGSAVPLFRLPVGEYYVVARHGVAFQNAVIEVGAGSLTEFVFDMDVGYVRASAIPTTGAAPLDDDMFYWVYEARKDLQGNRKEVTRSGSAVSLFRLPAGDYHMVARHGVAFASLDFSIDADSLLEPVLDMNVGYVRLASVLTEGMAPSEDGPFWWVYEAQTDLQGNRKEVTRSGSAKPIFKLPAGDYHLVVRHGDAITSRALSVDAGSLADIEVDQNAAHLKLTALVSEGGAPLDGDIFWYILSPETDLQGNREEITRSGNAVPIFTLTAGDYIARLRHGGATYDFPISLTAGDTADTKVAIN